MKIPKLSNKNIIIICSILFFVIFIYSLFLSYNIGFYQGANIICEPLTLGIDNNGNYVCFNENLQQKGDGNYYKTNFSMEGLKWS